MTENWIRAGQRSLIVALGILSCASPFGDLHAEEQKAIWTANEAGFSGEGKIVIARHRLLSRKDGKALHLELNAKAFDPQKGLRVKVTPNVGEIEARASDLRKRSLPVKVSAGGRFEEVSAGEFEYVPFDGVAVDIEGGSGVRNLLLESDRWDEIVAIEISSVPPEIPEVADLAPEIRLPRFRPERFTPSIESTEAGFVIHHPGFDAYFETRDGLRLASLLNRYSGKEVLNTEDLNAQLFLVRVGDRRIAPHEWSVKKVERIEGVPKVKVTLQSGSLTALLSIAAEEEGMRLGLTLGSQDAAQTWSAAFPYIRGLTLSSEAAKDYYLFPYFGGILHRVNADLRSLYGMRSAWWQMVTLFSPEEGTALMLRSLDTKGQPKGIALRKGMTHPRYATLKVDVGKRVPPDYLWKDSIEATAGTSLAFEYPPSAYLKKDPAGNICYPDALLSFHAGDWREPMAAYAAWAKRVWQWQKGAPQLRDKWNLRTLSTLEPVRSNSHRLYENGEWYGSYQKDRIDIAEYNFWWRWSEVGPFGVDLNNAKAEAGAQFYQRFRYFFDQKDPSTGKPAYKVNYGDYDYNPGMGGLEGLQRGIALAHKEKALVQFYTCPFLADDNSDIGRTYGPRLGVVNPSMAQLPPDILPRAPRDGHYIAYGKWRMCMDCPEYLDIFAEKAVKLARETGVDILRFDVLGTGGEACYNDQHSHRHALTGDLGAMRGSRDLVEGVRRRAREEGLKDLLLSAEYPGADFLASQLDSALTYELGSWRVEGLRPIPVNLFRFAFPDLRLFDLIEPRDRNPLFPNLAFFNAVGVFGEMYPPYLHQILKENSDAFSSAAVYPLVRTLQERVYANRFHVGDKEVVLFYNARPEEFAGPLWRTEEAEGIRYIDLLSGRTLKGRGGALALTLPPGGIAAIARVKKIANLHRESEGKLTLKMAAPDPALTYSLCSSDGLPLQSAPVHQEETPLTLLPEGCDHIKIYRGGNLVDVLPLLKTAGEED